MKLRSIAIAIILAGMTSVAMADNPVQTAQPQTLPTITTSQVVSGCMSSDRAPSHGCAVLYQMLNANFTPREIRAIVTWQTSHPQYLFDTIYALHDRFNAVVNEYVAAQRGPDAHEVATR